MGKNKKYRRTLKTQKNNTMEFTKQEELTYRRMIILLITLIVISTILYFIYHSQECSNLWLYELLHKYIITID